MNIKQDDRQIEIVPIEVAMSQIAFPKIDPTQMLQIYTELIDKYKPDSINGAYRVIRDNFRDPVILKLSSALGSTEKKFHRVQELIDLVRLFGVVKMAILLNEQRVTNPPFGIDESEIRSLTFDDVMVRVSNIFEDFDSAPNKIEYLVYILCILDHALALTVIEN